MCKATERAALEAQMAAFRAKGGQVTELPVSATNGMRHKDWKAATRGESFPAHWTAEQEAEQFAERVRDAGMIGGRSAAVDEMNGRR